jgi:cell division protein FtsN
MALNTSGSSGKSRFWGGFALGLLGGLALALAVTLVVTRNNPFVAASPAPVAQVEPPAKPAKPASPADAPTYDFYKSLPANTNANSIAETPAPQFWLQAGAFQHAEEADNMKAKLALLGVEADIEPAELADQGTLYRVRIGPMHTRAELEATRKRLMDNAIAAEPVKNSEPK